MSTRLVPFARCGLKCWIIMGVQIINGLGFCGMIIDWRLSVCHLKNLNYHMHCGWLCDTLFHRAAERAANPKPPKEPKPKKSLTRIQERLSKEKSRLAKAEHRKNNPEKYQAELLRAKEMRKMKKWKKALDEMKAKGEWILLKWLLKQAGLYILQSPKLGDFGVF